MSFVVCHEHQCGDMECGCGEIRVSRACPNPECGMEMQVLCGQYICPECDLFRLPTTIYTAKPLVNQKRKKPVIRKR